MDRRAIDDIPAMPVLDSSYSGESRAKVDSAETAPETGTEPSHVRYWDEKNDVSRFTAPEVTV